MLSIALTIARTTFIESLRQPIYFLMILICGLMQMFNTAFTGYSMGYSNETGEVNGDNKLLLDLSLATVLFCGTLLAGFIATAAVSREIENKTVLTVVSKPVPRPAVVLGKYLGSVGALLVAALIMIMFLQMALRHGVLSTVRDEADMPVIIFTAIAVLGSIGMGVWGNFFYGWHFSQTASLLMAPLMTVAWLIVLWVNKKWEMQPPFIDFKPQIAMACICLVLALVVLASLATAASTRLGQVMTVVICFGAFLLGLLSNHFIGKRAYTNEAVVQISDAKPERERFESFAGSGDTYILTLKSTPTKAILPGMNLYYGPNPNGFDLDTPAQTPFDGTLSNSDTFFEKGRAPGVIVTAAQGREITIRNIGEKPLAIKHAPMKDDYLFTTPTRINRAAQTAWGLIPNMQFFWLTDAITQNRLVPASHLLLVAGYAAAQSTVFLSLAVLLFQRREVG